MFRSFSAIQKSCLMSMSSMIISKVIKADSISPRPKFEGIYAALQARAEEEQSQTRETVASSVDNSSVSDRPEARHGGGEGDSIVHSSGRVYLLCSLQAS